MRHGPDIAALASLIGDPARANMLTALGEGEALTAGELAAEAGVTAQTASSHLARLVEARLLLVETQGRHRYFRLAGREVAQALEAIMNLAARAGRMRTRPGPRDAALRAARRCYDHLAGALGVALYDALLAQGLLTEADGALRMTPTGRARFSAMGVDVGALDASRRPACRACLDWSERRRHLAGGLGAALLQRFLAQGWLRRVEGVRALDVTPPGRRGFAALMAPHALAQAD